MSGVKGNNVGEYLKGATEAGATLAKEAIQINDSNKVNEVMHKRLYAPLLQLCHCMDSRGSS